MKKKVIFLDIDGTMIGYGDGISDSTRQAIQRARANGHDAVICTGRSAFQVSKELREVGFDGIVGAAGTFVEYHGHDIYHEYIPLNDRKWLIEYMERNKFVYAAQGSKGLITNQRCMEGLQEVYRNFNVEEDKLRDVLGTMKIIENVWECEDEEKVVYHLAPFNLEQVQKDISPVFEVTAFSFNKSKDSSGEINMAGINKATGMKHYLDNIGCTREDAIAVGDGPNDIEMLQYAGTAVAMGNAWDSVKQVADFVTTNVDDDGIYHAFEKLGLI